MRDVTRSLCLVLCSVLGCAVDAAAPDPTDGATNTADASPPAIDASAPDATDVHDATDASDASVASGVEPLNLGTVSDDGTTTCPRDAPPGSRCRHVTVSGCPLIETESIGAVVAELSASGPSAGSILHLNGGGGEGFLTRSIEPYAEAGFQQVFVSWDSDWEQTATEGIKTAACRPATVVKWVFDVLHGGARSLPFCGEGKSGGSAQLGYALTHYGLGAYLDYVTEWAGPPFARIDLGCDGDAPATAEVCGATVTMRLPTKVGDWENMMAPLECGSTDVPATELERLRSDSIAVGGTYSFPDTRVEFFVCTQAAPAVTAMGQIFYETILNASGDDARVAFHCYGAADGCHGEGLGTAGDADRERAMIEGCVARHR